VLYIKLADRHFCLTFNICALYSVIIKLFGVFQPSNIFFAMDGSVKIGDFGLVTAIEENCDNGYNTETPPLHDGRHTDQVGTKLYMSPEQVRARSHFNHFVSFNYFTGLKESYNNASVQSSFTALSFTVHSISCVYYFCVTLR